MSSFRSHRRLVSFLAILALLLVVSSSVTARTPGTTFSIVRSAKAAADGCLPNAAGTVTIRSLGTVEQMTVIVTGLPKNTNFDVFVIQLPNAPFGVAWYQGDLETDSVGHGRGDFIGRFNIETFAVAPGVGAAPDVHSGGTFPDATSNPAFAPIHMFHIGIWFNSPTDAQAAGCSATMTPFNGEHTAGIQALSTRNFPDLSGPLEQVQ